MSRVLFYVIALLASVIIVKSVDSKYQIRQPVISLYTQCVNNGFYGECWYLNRNGDYPHCSKTFCKSRGNEGPVPMGHQINENAPDGLKCGPNKMCYHGACVSSVRIPIQPPPRIYNFYNECVR